MEGSGREGQPSPFVPLMSTHPGLPVLLSHKSIVLGVKALDDSHRKGGEVWHCVGEKWGPVFWDVFFSA